MQAWFIQQGHSAIEANEGAVQVTDALNATLNSKHGQWVLYAHSDAASELSLFDANAQAVSNHIIDRTFVENGVRWIVDYKLTHNPVTQANENVDLKSAAELHRPQLERYAALFSNGGLPVRKAVFFLTLGELVELF
jgi:ATP-dependent exoDNAse (exonuclease V) beta subunit